MWRRTTQNGWVSAFRSIRSVHKNTSVHHVFSLSRRGHSLNTSRVHPNWQSVSLSKCEVHSLWSQEARNMKLCEYAYEIQHPFSVRLNVFIKSCTEIHFFKSPLLWMLFQNMLLSSSGRLRHKACCDDNKGLKRVTQLWERGNFPWPRSLLLCECHFAWNWSQIGSWLPSLSGQFSIADNTTCLYMLNTSSSYQNRLTRNLELVYKYLPQNDKVKQ